MSGVGSFSSNAMACAATGEIWPEATAGATGGDTNRADFAAVAGSSRVALALSCALEAGCDGRSG
jgi:hypothetical protein